MRILSEIVGSSWRICVEGKGVRSASTSQKKTRPLRRKGRTGKLGAEVLFLLENIPPLEKKGSFKRAAYSRSKLIQREGGKKKGDSAGLSNNEEGGDKS